MATSCGFESHRPHQVKARFVPEDQGGAMRRGDVDRCPGHGNRTGTDAGLSLLGQL
jgi:hypothetical protein